MLHKHYVILLNPVVAYLILCGFPPFFLERTWWRLFQKRVVPTKLDIYIFIIQYTLLV